MPIVKSIPIKKFINGDVVELSESALVTDQEYTTNGEYVIVVDSVDNCNIILDHKTTTHIVIKSLTNVTITPLDGKIDKEWDDIQISKGACIELKYILHDWYILSSDGLKFG